MPESTTIRYEADGGIVTLVLDAPGSSANTLTDAFRGRFEAVIERLEAERDTLSGVIITSAKPTFFAGADLNALALVRPEHAAEVTARATRTKGLMRRLEKLGLPVVAVINGSALGGGAELTLACHRRIVVNDPSIRIGFPEVTLGLLPGGGGIVRTTRMLGIRSALDELLLSGRPVNPARALELGLVDEIASDGASARALAVGWIATSPEPSQPWDRKGFAFPGGDGRSPAIVSVIAGLSAGLRGKLAAAPNIAPHHILSAAIEGSIVDVDTALAVETRYYVDLVTNPVSTNVIQGSFLDRQSLTRGADRPAGTAGRSARRVAVIGAGMMGAGIAYSCARAGLDVVLTDVSEEVVERGKAYSTKVLDRAVAKEEVTAERRSQVLDRITTTTSLETVADCDVIIEAVFEDQKLKAELYASVEQIVAPTTLIASNTSTIPITDLAERLTAPERFVGLHFFSPVDRMELVEVIRGGKTSDETLAAAIDLVGQIRKVPIVVRDSRGFFTSRVFGKFTREGVAMLAERVPPASINQASMQAGYPVPVLQLSDELSLTLPQKIRAEAMAAAAAAGETWIPHPSEPVYDTMVDDLNRPGRAGGAGFYDYEDGVRTRLWPGLADAFGPQDKDAVPFRDLIDRLLFSEAVEALRCLDEGVISSAAAANVGSLLGISYPRWTGGVIQFVNAYEGGPAGFRARALELAERYGPRFSPPELLATAADAGELVA
jgi:3-hydroxyacyl-CoA dehydrogenase/enoyl-CoA hydratase/3-hydroxybutyryl-CoA epimerase